MQLSSPLDPNSLEEGVRPLLTIVVPIARYPLFARRALRGLASQNTLLRNSVQLIFVADGVGISPAQRAHIQRECTGYHSLNYVELPYNTYTSIVSDPGAIPIAVGFAIAKGSFVACIGEDNAHTENYLDTVLPILSNSAADLLFFNRDMYSSVNEEFLMNDDFESTGWDSFIDPNCYIFSAKALVTTLGLWRINFPYGADRAMFTLLSDTIKSGQMVCQPIAQTLLKYYVRPEYEKRLLAKP